MLSNEVFHMQAERAWAAAILPYWFEKWQQKVEPILKSQPFQWLSIKIHF